MDVCTRCGEPFTEIEEQLLLGTGSIHRRCPTLASWRDEAVKWCLRAAELKTERDWWETQAQRFADLASKNRV